MTKSVKMLLLLAVLLLLAGIAGTWYVMPELDYDHLSIIGGIFNEQGSSIREFYRTMMDRIWSLKMKIFL